MRTAARTIRHPTPPAEADGHASKGDVPRYGLTDLGNARRIVDHFGRDIRYCAPFKTFLAWDETRWAFDRKLWAHSKAKTVYRLVLMELATAGIVDKETVKAYEEWAEASQFRRKIDDALPGHRSNGNGFGSKAPA